MTDNEKALARAIQRAGNAVKLAEKLGLNFQAVYQWKECPPKRCIEVEQITGVSRHELRPDVFGAP